MDDAVDLAQNRPLWRLIDVYVRRYAVLVVLAGNDDDDDDSLKWNSIGRYLIPTFPWPLEVATSFTIYFIPQKALTLRHKLWLTDLKIADGRVPVPHVNDAMGFIVLNHVISTQPFHDHIGLSQHATSYVTSTPRPRIRCSLMIGCKPWTNLHTHAYANMQAPPMPVRTEQHLIYNRPYTTPLPYNDTFTGQSPPTNKATPWY